MPRPPPSGNDPTIEPKNDESFAVILTWGPKKMRPMLRRCLLHIAFDNVQEPVFSPAKFGRRKGSVRRTALPLRRFLTTMLPGGCLRASFCGLLVPGPLGDDPPLFPEFF